MRLTNRLVATVLRSRVHGLASGAVCLVRYVGRRSNRVITTPVQYATVDDDVVILAGRAATKSWWRNFDTPRDIDLLVRSRWAPMRGRVVRGRDEPAEAARLLDAYLTRFPKAARALPRDPAERLREVVLVHCTPRPTSGGRPTP